MRKRVDDTGNSLWTNDGIAVIEQPGNQGEHAIECDGVGGAIILWEDARKETGDLDIFSQRVNGEGTLLWDSAGVPVATAMFFQKRPALIPDGSGGAFITWMDFYRGGTWWEYLRPAY